MKRQWDDRRKEAEEGGREGKFTLFTIYYIPITVGLLKHMLSYLILVPTCG